MRTTKYRCLNAGLWICLRISTECSLGCSRQLAWPLSNPAEETDLQVMLCYISIPVQMSRISNGPEYLSLGNRILIWWLDHRWLQWMLRITIRIQMSTMSKVRWNESWQTLFKNVTVIQCSNVSQLIESCRDRGRKFPAATGKNRIGVAVTGTSRPTAWITGQ